ncbi:MAG: hypothetical protein EOP84_31310, partial [Verrucomicrobiaceae bacterium]
GETWFPVQSFPAEGAISQLLPSFSSLQAAISTHSFPRRTLSDGATTIHLSPNSDYSAILTNGAWHHIALVRTIGAQGAITLYIDGVQAASMPNSSPLVLDSSASLKLGVTTQEARFIGSLDEFRITREALLPAQIAAYWNQDLDTDGYADWWKWAYFPSTPASQIDWTADLDGDGRTTAEEYTDRTDPSDYFNGVKPSIHVVPNEGAYSGEAGGILAAPIVFEIRKPDGSPSGGIVPNAPVTISAPIGGRLISATGMAAKELSLTTDGSGQVSVRVKLPTQRSQSFQVECTAGTSSETVNVSTTNEVARLDSWEFSVIDTSGVTISEAGNTGTFQGGLSYRWASGAHGAGLNFDGIDDSVVFTESEPAVLNFGDDQSFSLSLWVKMQPNQNGIGRIIS